MSSAVRWVRENITSPIGHAIEDTVKAVVHNPVGALVDVGLLYMGVPPVIAGGAAGAANALANHTDVLKGALTGGAMAYAAGAAGDWANATGLGSVASAATAGAAAGATGAALTGQGMGYVVRGALSGGVMGGAVGYIQKPNGTITYTYDDGSTLTRNADGTFSSTAAGSIPAPVVDKSTYSTDKVNLSSSWPIKVDAAPGTVWTGPAGAEIVLNDGKVLPMDIYRSAVATGKPIFVDGVAIDMNLENIAHSQGNLNNPQGIVDTYRTPGTALASIEEINTGKANYNPQAHAWETTQVTDANSSSVYHPSDITHVGAQPGQGAGAMVQNITSTGMSDSAPGTIYQGPNGPEIVLNNGKTVMLHDYETMLNSTGPVAVDGQQQTQFRVEMGGSAGYKDNPSMVKQEFRTPDTELASQEQIDSGEAKWNAAANAWEVGTGPVTGEITKPIEPTTVGSHPEVVPVDIMKNPEHVEVDAGKGWVAYNPDGSSYGVDNEGKTFQHGAGTLTEGGGAGPEGGKTITYDDGSTITIHNDGRVTSTPATGGGTTGPVKPEEPLKPLPHEEIPPTEPIKTLEPEPTPKPEEPTPTPTPTPIVPIIPPTPAPKAPEYTVNWGTSGAQNYLNTNAGLNPGWIQPVAQYQTTSPVQSQYHWGAAPFQPGPTFNPALAAQGIGAHQTPWGLQQMYHDLTPQQTAALVSQASYHPPQQSHAHAATPVQPVQPEPVATLAPAPTPALQPIDPWMYAVPMAARQG